MLLLLLLSLLLHFGVDKSGVDVLLLEGWLNLDGKETLLIFIFAVDKNGVDVLLLEGWLNLNTRTTTFAIGYDDGAVGVMVSEVEFPSSIFDRVSQHFDRFVAVVVAAVDADGIAEVGEFLDDLHRAAQCGDDSPEEEVVDEVGIDGVIVAAALAVRLREAVETGEGGGVNEFFVGEVVADHAISRVLLCDHGVIAVRALHEDVLLFDVVEDRLDERFRISSHVVDRPLCDAVGKRALEDDVVVGDVGVGDEGALGVERCGAAGVGAC